MPSALSPVLGASMLDIVDRTSNHPAPAAARMGELTKAKVSFIDECVGNTVAAAAEALAGAWQRLLPSGA
mgnify:CR=1 FL=1